MDNSTLEIQVLTDIGGWGFGLNDLISSFKSHEGNDVVMPINSYGGEVLEGIAVYNMMKSSGKNITANIVGYAMSMGTALCCGATKCTMASNGYYMIHEPWVGTYGDADTLQKDSNLLESMAVQLVDIYHAKTGLDKVEIRSMMKEETWLTAQQALDFGFIDEIREPTDKILASFDVSKFKNTPKNIIQNNIKASQMDFNKKIYAAFGMTDKEIESGDTAKIVNAMASIAKVDGIVARMEEIEDTQTATIDTITKETDAKIKASEEATTKAIESLVDFETEGEDRSDLVKIIDKLNEENASLKEQIANQDKAIADGLLNIDTKATEFHNSLNNKQIGKTIAQEVTIARAKQQS